MNRLYFGILCLMVLVGFVGCGLPPQDEPQPTSSVKTPSSPQTPTVPRLPSDGTTRGDVAVLQTVLSDRMPLPGQVIVAATTLKNMANKTSAAGQIRFYLSNDRTHGSGDLFLNEAPLPRLKGAEPHLQKSNLRIPSLPPGVYYILVTLRMNNSGEEQELTNNVKALNIEIRSKSETPAPKPAPKAPATQGYDWSVGHAAASLDIVRPGQRISVSCVVKNQGTLALPTGRLRYYLSTDRRYDSEDRYLNHDAVDALEPGQTSREEANMHLPDQLAPGRYFLLFVMDPDQAVAEGDEANNVVALPIEIR